MSEASAGVGHTRSCFAVSLTILFTLASNNLPNAEINMCGF